MDLRYVAGFFDGEGSVGLYASKNKRYALRACITQVRSPNADRLFLDLAERFGGSVSHNKVYSKKHQPAMMWSIYGDRAASFLAAISEHLRLKKGQAQLVISWQAEFGSDRVKRNDGGKHALKRQRAAESVMAVLTRMRSKRKS